MCMELSHIFRWIFPFFLVKINQHKNIWRNLMANNKTIDVWIDSWRVPVESAGSGSNFLTFWFAGSGQKWTGPLLEAHLVLEGEAKRAQQGVSVGRIEGGQVPQLGVPAEAEDLQQQGGGHALRGLKENMRLALLLENLGTILISVGTVRCGK